MLGVATLPMKLLMDQPVIDGYAPVQGPCNVGGKVEDVSMLIYHRKFFIFSCPSILPHDVVLLN